MNYDLEQQKTKLFARICRVADDPTQKLIAKLYSILQIYANENEDAIPDAALRGLHEEVGEFLTSDAMEELEFVKKEAASLSDEFRDQQRMQRPQDEGPSQLKELMASITADISESPRKPK